MTNTTRFRAVAGAALLAGALACNNDKLTSVNRNPNNPTDASATSLFTNAVRTGVARWLGQTYDLRAGEFVIQHLAEVQYTDEDIYKRLARANLTGTFDQAYYQELQDLAIADAKGQTAKDPGIWAPAQVMRVWDADFLTDGWGAVPYSQALAGDSGKVTPAYDPQKQIYASFFSTLSADATALAASGTTASLGTADPIYTGNPASWAKFANSLHARLALRIVNADAATASAELQKALNGPGGTFTSNADNAKLVWPGDGINDNPWAASLKTRDDYRMSKTFISVLDSLSDPRLPIFAMPTAAGTYTGAQNGLLAAQAQQYITGASRMGAIFFPGATSYGTFGGSGARLPSYLMTYSELLFIKAEAAERGMGGLNAGQAAGFYNAAITASMQQWGVSDQATIDAYLAQPAVVYKGGVAGQIQIATQKWIALFTDGAQAWAEWRRTCRPATIAPGPAAVVNYVPRRFYYSQTELSVNAANVQAAVAEQKTDNFAGRVWWDQPQNAPTCQGVNLGLPG